MIVSNKYLIQLSYYQTKRPITDGAYSGAENEQLAKKKNVRLVTTNLTGRQADDIMADFKFSENGQEVLRCPGGHTPKSCSYNAATGQCTVSFHKNYCEECPIKTNVIPKCSSESVGRQFQ